MILKAAEGKLTEKQLLLGGTLSLFAADAGASRRFNILAYSGGKLRVDGFPLPVIVDLSALEIPSETPILIDHTASVDATLGTTNSHVNTGQSLTLGGIVTGQSPLCQQVIAQADAGHKWQASIGCVVSDVEEINAGQSIVVNCQTFQGPVLVARRAILRETSVLPKGADPTTSVNLAASVARLLKGAAAMSFEEWLASLGVDVTAISDADKQALMSAFDATMNPAAPPAAAAPVAATAPAAPSLPHVAAASGFTNLNAALALHLDTVNKSVSATFRRHAEIQAKCVGYPLIAAAAIEHPEWTMDKVELEILKANQAKVRPTSFNNAEKDLPQGEVLEAAICMARKTLNHEKEYKPEILQAAQSQYKGIGLKQIFLVAAIANGYQDRSRAGVHRGNIGEVLRFANRRPEEQSLEASGFSSMSLPGILSNVANKEILTGYMEEDDGWREVFKIKSVSDFKAVTSYRMLDDMEFEELGSGGKIVHGAIDEESYTRQVKTYAKMFALTRDKIIDDDLGVLDDLRNIIGKGSSRKLRKIVWSGFMNNSSFFTSARTNYISGSTTNLGTDGVGLGLAVTAFRKMTSPTADGLKRVGAGDKPRILLVPPELEHNADKLYVGANLNMGSGSSEENTHRNKYKPVTVWQLSDSNYTGYSTTAFYLLGDKESMPTGVVSFLNGVEVPTVETSESEFNTLGVLFRGYHDFGFDKAEYMGGLKSKGAA
jgi:hypothetical protein